MFGRLFVIFTCLMRNKFSLVIRQLCNAKKHQISSFNKVKYFIAFHGWVLRYIKPITFLLSWSHDVVLSIFLHPYSFMSSKPLPPSALVFEIERGSSIDRRRLSFWIDSRLFRDCLTYRFPWVRLDTPRVAYTAHNSFANTSLVKYKKPSIYQTARFFIALCPSFNLWSIPSI